MLTIHTIETYTPDKLLILKTTSQNLPTGSAHSCT